MRYFTRAWHDAACETMMTLGSERARGQYNETREAYLAYLDSVWDEMDDEVRVLAECYLHDFRVYKAIIATDKRDLSLELHYASKRHPKDTIINFSSVDEPVMIADIEGDRILHYEVAVRKDGTYEFSALLDKTAFSIGFKRVRVVGAVRARKDRG